MKNMERTPVQLTGGAGLVYRTNENYLPGEYSVLKNVTLTNRNSIIKRKPANGLMHDRAVGLLRMIGSWGPSAVYSSQIGDTGGAMDQELLSPDIYYSYGNNEIRKMTISNYAAFKTALYSAAAVDGGFPDLEGTDYFSFEGCFQYNNKAYFLVLVTNKYNPDAARISYRNILYCIEATGFVDFRVLEPITISLSTAKFDPIFVNAQNYGAFYSNPTFNPLPTEYVSSYFIYKERLWIHSMDTILFSKATDPQQFTPGLGGGFFKFPGKNITDALYLADSIYVIFDNSISVLRYNSDPNSDASITEISVGIGGKSACVYGDTVYVLDYNNIYEVNGNNVGIFAELDQSLLTTYPQFPTSHLDLVNGSSSGLNIEAFDGFLYFTEYRLVFSTRKGPIWAVSRLSGNNLFKISLSDGHLTEESFTGNSSPCDMKVITYSTGLKSDSRMFMFFNTSLISLNGSTSGSFFYNQQDRLYVNNITSVEAGLDSYSNTGGTDLNVIPIIVNIMIQRWSPDGLFHHQKKFRQLQIQAKVSSLVKNSDTLSPNQVFSPELEILAMSNARHLEILSTQALSELIHSNLDQFSIAYDGLKGFSFRLNQRLTSISLIIRTKNDYNTTQLLSEYADFGDNAALDALNASLMEINDISFVWTPLLSGTDTDKRFKAPY